MRATGSRVKKKVIRNNTVGPLLVVHLCFGKRERERKKKNNPAVFCTVTNEGVRVMCGRWASWESVTTHSGFCDIQLS